MTTKSQYVTVGVSTEEREDSGTRVVAVGKRNATFEISGVEFERTALLKLPEKMTPEEFEEWKNREDIDMIDIYFHSVWQVPLSDDAREEHERGGQETLVSDGGYFERVIENDTSSSDIVVRASEHAIEITLDPMTNPIERLDIYSEEAEEFAEAVDEALEFVKGEGSDD